MLERSGMFSLNAYLHEYFSFTGLKLIGYFQLKMNLQEHQEQTTTKLSYCHQDKYLQPKMANVMRANNYIHI